MAIWCSFIAEQAMTFGNHILLNKQWQFGALLLLNKQSHLAITYC
jgi:hypothetical protein